MSILIISIFHCTGDAYMTWSCMEKNPDEYTKMLLELSEVAGHKLNIERSVTLL